MCLFLGVKVGDRILYTKNLAVRYYGHFGISVAAKIWAPPHGMDRSVLICL